MILEVRVDGQTKDGRLQWYAQVRLVPGCAIVAADEKSAPASSKIFARREIKRLGIPWSVGEHPAVRADRAQTGRLEVAPVQAAIDATESAKACRGGQLTWVFRVDHHRVNVD